MERQILNLTIKGMEAAALIEDGQLMELIPKQEQTNAGGIFLGRIERYVPGMQAVFVDIGLEKNGFLPLSETQGETPAKLKTGASIVVQVKKEPLNEKGSYLSTDISLPGAYCVYRPFGNGLGISAKITHWDLRESLKQVQVQSGGAIIRTAAQNADLKDIQREVAGLEAIWESILSLSKQYSAPKPLWAPMDALARLRTDYEGRYNTQTNPATETLEKQLEEALKRKVWLKSGGFLVIDPCEAMTVIDVNTGKFTGKKRLDETILKTNLEACEKIAQQIRLRNLSGIIVVDFIDMDSKKQQEQVLKKQTDVFMEDRKQTEILGFTKLGLLEITRKRDSLPLRAVLKE